MAKKSRAERKREAAKKVEIVKKTETAKAKTAEETMAKARNGMETKGKEQDKKAESDRIFMERLKRHHDELRWLYMELYDNADMFAELCSQMKWYYDQRNDKLRKLDAEREAAGEWYRKRDMVGMMMYIDNFAGTIKGVQEKLPYIEKCNVNYIHLMPFLDSPKGRSDGGYAVADFRKVKPELGTMDDLAALAEECHDKGISLCMDFVMNHTSEDHDWARRARQGDGEYMEGVKFSVSMGKIFFDKNQICIIVLFKFLVFCCRIIYLIIVLPIRLRLYLNFKIFCSTNSGISNPFFVGSAHTRPQE